MDELMGLFLLIPIVLGVVWVVFTVKGGLNSINRTGRSIGKWNKKQLGEDDE